MSVVTPVTEALPILGAEPSAESSRALPQSAAHALPENHLRPLATALVVSVGVVGVASGWTVLSTLLVVLPLIAVGVARRKDFSARWRIWFTIVSLFVAAVVPTLISLPLAHLYSAFPVWWSSLLRGWGMIGLVGMALVIGWRCWPVGSSRWRVIPALLLHGLLIVSVPPLGALYVQHLTSPDFPKVIALSQREDVTLTMTDGTRLDARWYHPVNSEPRGVVVFTHGYSGWKEGFLNHLHLFLDQGWAVLAYDMRGHGRSSPAVVSYGAREADDLVQVWREAQRRASGLPLVAYGVSLGSVVTLLAAERLPGCHLMIVESPFPDVGAMMRSRLAPAVLPLALAVARGGAGFDPIALVPQRARLPEPGTRLVVSWIRTDAVIPAAASRTVAAAFPGAVIFEMQTGEHLDLIVHQPYHDLLSGLFAEIR